MRLVNGTRAPRRLSRYVLMLVCAVSVSPAVAQPIPNTAPRIDPYRELSEEGKQELLDLTFTLLDKRRDWIYRQSAAKDIYEIAHIDALPALLAAARDPTEKFMVRQRSIIAIGRIETDRVVNYLIDLLPPDRRVGSQARDTLRNITKVGFKFDALWNTKNPRKIEDALLDLQKLWRTWWKITRGKVNLAHSHANEYDPLIFFEFEP